MQQAGYREVVTNALGPGASLPLVDVGFAVKGRLHLLVHDMADIPAPTDRTRRAGRSDRPALLAADAAAFDEFWRFDEVALREAARRNPARPHPGRPADGRAARDTACSGGPEAPATSNDSRWHPRPNTSGSGTPC